MNIRTVAAFFRTQLAIHIPAGLIALVGALIASLVPMPDWAALTTLGLGVGSAIAWSVYMVRKHYWKRP